MGILTDIVICEVIIKICTKQHTRLHNYMNDLKKQKQKKLVAEGCYITFLCFFVYNLNSHLIFYSQRFESTMTSSFCMNDFLMLFIKLMLSSVFMEPGFPLPKTSYTPKMYSYIQCLVCHLNNFVSTIVLHYQKA